MSQKISKRKIDGPIRNTRPNTTCQYCGKEFHVKPCALKRGRGKYCSKECMSASGSVIKKCEVCKKEFSFKRSHDANGHGRYCSMKCRSIGFDQRGILKGENAPRYIDGKSKTKEYVRQHSHFRRVKIESNGGVYTLDEWRELCEKYGNRCLCCGRNDVQLTVDHIIPVIDGGTNSISNLQPLCKSCNSKKNRKHIDYRIVEA